MSITKLTLTIILLMILIVIIVLCETVCTPQNIRTVVDLEKPHDRSNEDDESLNDITTGNFILLTDESYWILFPFLTLAICNVDVSLRKGSGVLIEGAHEKLLKFKVERSINSVTCSNVNKLENSSANLVSKILDTK